jgi:hypothetical protein
MNTSLITKAYIVSGMPHILLAPERSAGWGRLRSAFEAIRADIDREEADLILYFSGPRKNLWVSFAHPSHPRW